MIPRKGFPEKSTIAARFIIFFLFCITALFTAQSVLAAEVQVRDDAGSPISGINVYAFSTGGAYTGVNSSTDSDGNAVFNSADLSAGPYRFRADYRGYQFWSNDHQVEPDSAIPLTIAHQQVTITVGSMYEGADLPLEGVPVYVFTEGGAYMNLNATTDAGGTVTFNLPQQAYKFRADYFGAQYWTDPVTWQDATIQVPLAEAEVMVTGMGQPLENVPVYVFATSGAYLSRNGTTNADGKVTFRIPAGDYKFRADYQGSQYWSADQALAADQVNPVGVSTGGGIFEFTVLRGVSDPLVGVSCYLFTEAGSYLNQTAVTDANGQVTFPLADGTYKIRTDFQGYQYWSEVYTVPTTLAGAVTIAHQPVVVAVSSDYQGTAAPLEDIPVYVYTEGGAYMNLNATTDAGGTVTFNLPQQAYKFRADYFGAQYWTDPVTWQDATIQVPLAEAEVMVTGMGQPLENVPVYLFATTGAYLSRNKTTNADGKVIFRIPAGDYKFRADYQSSQYWSADQALAADQVNPVGVSTGGGIFEFTVLRGVSDPLVGVSCYLFTEAGSYLNQTAVTDANGQVTFPLADGTYKIRTDFQGYQYWSEVYTVPTTLARAVTIAHQPVVITVNSDYQGTAEPLEGIPVYVYTDGGAYMNLIATTDAGGTVTFNLPQQVYKFRADYFGAQYWSDPVTWQDATIQVPLAEAEIIVTGMGQPVENVPVYVFATSGAYLNRNGTTDVDGKVTFRIPAGDYKFRADYQGSQYWSADQALVADQVNPVGVSTGGGIFEFTVLRGVSDPLVGVNCYLFTEAGSYLNQTAVTDVEGKVTFSLADGSYKIRTDYSGYQYWSDVYLVPDVLSDVFTIAHQATTISVVSTYPESTVHAGLPVYLFTSSGSYLGQSRTTDVNGQVAFYLPDSTFKVRVDYMSRQFWSEEFQFENGTVTIPMGTARVHVSNLDADVQDANVYLFSEGGGYLNVLQATDPVGSADFVLPAGYFKFRVDFDGKQYWSPVVDILANQINPVEIDISPLSVTLSAEPATIIQGQSVELTWTSRQATSASIDNSIGEVAVNGSLTVTPTETTTYTITVTGPEGTEAASTTVTVTAAPTAEIQVVEPDGIGDTADQAFAIFWKGTYSAQYAVSLYYDVDNTGFDGVLIADSLTGIGDGATNNEYIWDTSGTPAGVYYIYAVADDGQGQSVKAYSTFPLVISHAAPPLTLNQFEIDNAAASSEEGGAPALHINGDFAILGANGDDWLNIPGSAHVFKKTDQGWVY